jgi:hypothetical protein
LITMPLEKRLQGDENRTLVINNQDAMVLHLKDLR